MPSIHIVNPRGDFPSYHSAEAFGDPPSNGWVSVADLSITTVAALVPPGWDIRLTDENISPVNLDAPSDFVALTGKVSQRTRMYELAAAFRARGRVVLIGGSFASLTVEDVQPHADILVTGELEDLAPRLFADLAAGTWDRRYDGGQSDMSRLVIPRWDLYPVQRAMFGAVQTTRGCPFSCEFCDVIQYQGRKQRSKPVANIMAELDVLYQAGFRRIFIVDDNFTVHRRRAHELLTAIAAWNRCRADDPVTFLTQASLDLARDEHMMDACVNAGVTLMYVGIETINEASLRETGKKQNLLQPITTAVDQIVGSGIAISGGVIVGFDNDGPDIFRRQLDFFQSAPLPDLSIGALSAPISTPLYDRLKMDGRLFGEPWDAAANNMFSTNVIPAGMSRDSLLDGVQWLARTAYSADRFGQRMLTFIDTFGGPAAPLRGKARSQTGRVSVLQQAIGMISARGPDEQRMVAQVLKAAVRKPATLPAVNYYLTRYAQARHVLDMGRSLAATGAEIMAE